MEICKESKFQWNSTAAVISFHPQLRSIHLWRHGHLGAAVAVLRDQGAHAVHPAQVLLWRREAVAGAQRLDGRRPASTHSGRQAPAGLGTPSRDSAGRRASLPASARRRRRRPVRLCRQKQILTLCYINRDKVWSGCFYVGHFETVLVHKYVWSLTSVVTNLHATDLKRKHQISCVKNQLYRQILWISTSIFTKQFGKTEHRVVSKSTYPYCNIQKWWGHGQNIKFWKRHGIFSWLSKGMLFGFNSSTVIYFAREILPWIDTARSIHASCLQQSIIRFTISISLLSKT